MGEIVDALRRAHSEEPAKKPAPREIPLADSDLPVVGPDARRPDATERTTATEAGDVEPERRTPLPLQRDGDANWKAARTGLSDPHGDATQQFRRLAFRTRDLADARNARSIVITSAQMGDGKTTTICNLAIQLARLDRAQRVVLVDLDLRRPSIAPALGVDPEVSVEAVLRGERPIGDAIFETDVDGLSVMALKRPAADPESLLAHPNLGAMIRELEARFDRVLIDSPPVLAVTDVQLLLRHAAAGLFVARAGETTVKSARRALELLPTEKLLGSFLNSSPNAHTRTGYQYYREERDDDEEMDAAHEQ